jgi:transcriptional adapter 2-alpha
MATSAQGSPAAAAAGEGVVGGEGGVGALPPSGPAEGVSANLAAQEENVTSQDGEDTQNSIPSAPEPLSEAANGAEDFEVDAMDVVNDVANGGVKGPESLNLNLKAASTELDPRDMLPKGRGAMLCRFCSKDVGAGCRVRCAECSVDLCMECFSAGVKIDGHEPYHDYRIPHALDFPIFHRDWTAAEEVKLLDAVQRYGLGNWEEMSIQAFGKSKTARQVSTPTSSIKANLKLFAASNTDCTRLNYPPQIREHYLDDYFGWDGCFLPPNLVTVNPDGGVSLNPIPPVEGCAEVREGPGISSSYLATRSMGDIEGRSTDMVIPIIPADSSASLGPDGAVATAASDGVPTSAGAPPGTAEKGQLSGRGGGAKSSKKDRKSAAALQDHIASLPGADLVGYMPLRGDFDTEHDQDAEIVLADLEFNDDDDESERKLKHEVIAIYNKRLDERERRKRLIIERGLLDYKRLQAADRKRSPEERELVARLRVFARFHTADEHTAFVESILTAKRLRKRIERLQGWRKLGMRTLAEGAAYEEGRKARAEDAARQSVYESSGKSTHADRSIRYMAREGGGNEQQSAADAQNKAQVLSAPGVEMLTEKEQELCAALSLLPRQYLTAKNAMIRESATRGWLDKNSASRLVKIDVKQSESAYDFFVSCGWVTRDPHSEDGSVPLPVLTALTSGS